MLQLGAHILILLAGADEVDFSIVTSTGRTFDPRVIAAMNGILAGEYGLEVKRVSGPTVVASTEDGDAEGDGEEVLLATASTQDYKVVKHLKNCLLLCLPACERRFHKLIFRYSHCWVLVLL